MARSTYIYVVIRAVPIAAFTVKHELVSWLKRNQGDLAELVIWRLHDRPYSDSPAPVDITADLLPFEGAVQ